MAWFAIRSIYLFGQKSDGTNIFEEGVVCFQADSPSSAFAKAELESEQYAKDNEFDVFSEREAYEQDGDRLFDGYELWSVLFESRESLADFYANRYSQYNYRPEWQND